LRSSGPPCSRPMQAKAWRAWVNEIDFFLKIFKTKALASRRGLFSYQIICYCMTVNPEKHKRRSLRHKGYDYSAAGAYFVTICTHKREPLFGEIQNGTMMVNDYGQTAADAWLWLEQQYPYVKLDAWVVMPNHFHGIIIIADCRGGSRTAPTEESHWPIKPIGRLVGAFKTVSTKHINKIRRTPSAILWQRNYYEHVVRNDDDLNQVREYIINNPLKWDLDAENPGNTHNTVGADLCVCPGAQKTGEHAGLPLQSAIRKQS
jgi:putative transposase